MCKVLVLISVVMLCRAESFPTGITGVWVLDSHRMQFGSAEGHSKLVLRVDATEIGELCVWGIRTDAAGQHIQQRRYARVVAPTVAAARDATRAVILRDKATEVLEKWVLGPDGTLAVESAFVGDIGVPHHRLVFQSAERRALFGRHSGKELAVR